MRTLARYSIVALIALTGSMALVACDSQKGGSGSSEGGEEGEHAVVESGTYTGTIKKVKPSEKEIYVDADGKELELYFIDETKLTQKGKEAKFSALEKGQKVEVKLKKVGKRLDPLAVDILE
jgi:hypothetical protein